MPVQRTRYFRHRVIAAVQVEDVELPVQVKEELCRVTSTRTLSKGHRGTPSRATLVRVFLPDQHRDRIQYILALDPDIHAPPTGVRNKQVRGVVNSSAIYLTNLRNQRREPEYRTGRATPSIFWSAVVAPLVFDLSYVNEEGLTRAVYYGVKKETHNLSPRGGIWIIYAWDHFEPLDVGSMDLEIPLGYSNACTDLTRTGDVRDLPQPGRYFTFDRGNNAG
ncbi:hypothetical protein C8R44DRAFT_741689 [Mycena epipterygia]|nr:hypothetical protein C8R44DRAFT_741689 [Mycena epipterygia]